MLIPPDFYTQERVDSDLDILRLYYTLCDELNLTEDLKETFLRLSKLVGKPVFLKEFVLLAKFINNKRSKKKVEYEEEQSSDFYNKTC
ncbi:uncharacterized protein VNE69_10125 [Vairimorpha necatrix]|uniref:Uncharacterized protein n=1 Tax=Vairimorpha necatrix TaxID=6039 RepID=A0AAX4JFH9_9MICR